MNTDETGKEWSGQPRLILELTTDVDDIRPVFVTGNFNNWLINDPVFELKKIEDRKYRVEFPDHLKVPKPMEYKYVREGWEGEELDAYGNPVKNRVIEDPSGVIRDFVPRWEQELIYDSKFLPVIRTIAEDFEIPQLIKTRRISALLPYDYYDTDKRYPVLYLQDGQNLFDEFAPFGNWGLDKRLAKMAERNLHEIIIIAIDHAEHERIREYTPSFPTQLGMGEGKKYIRFLADTLKPFVDKNFRTLTDREYTGIGGSSMGGLVSIYAGLLYPEVYGKLMIFSPSLWVSPKVQFRAVNMEFGYQMRIYLYAGGGEGPKMLDYITQFKEDLGKKEMNKDLMQINLAIDPRGKHNEDRWGEEFPQAVKWLFFDK